METVSDLIEKLGPAALAGATGVSVQGISNMKQRGAIPVRHWAAVLELAKANDDLRDLNSETLVRLHTPPPKNDRPAEQTVGA